MSRKRLNPDVRREEILKAAMIVARRDGYTRMTRQAIAERAGASVGLVSRYFGTMPQLKRAVMRAAVTARDARLVAQGLAAGDPHARKADGELKRAALEAI